MAGSRHSMQEVIPGLFIGSQFALALSSSLKNNWITHMLSVNNCKDFPPGYITKVINIDDDEDENISIFFDECIDFINSGHRTFVFCMAGRSRSATIVAAYLIREKNMTLNEALETINRVRSVNPNPGFMKQLQYFDNKIHCELCRLERKSE